MHYSLFFTEGQFKKFKDRLVELNRYLKYFPIPTGKDKVESLPEEKLVEIVDQAKPLQYQRALLQSNYDPYSKTLAEYSQYIKRLEASNLIRKRLKDLEHGSGKSHGKGRHKRYKGGTSSESVLATRTTKKSVCSTCSKFHKGPCWNDPKNAHLRPNKKPRIGDNKKASKVLFTAEQFNYLVSRLHANKPNEKSKKRTVHYDDNSEDKSQSANLIQKLTESLAINNSSDSEVDAYLQTCYHIGRLNKRSKTTQHSTEVVVEIKDRNNELVPIRCLLNTGISSTILLKPFINAAKSYRQPSATM